MLKDTRTGEVGFVIPKDIAVDYRNLLLLTLPAMEEQIDTLKLSVAKHKSILVEREEQIGLLNDNVADAQQQLAAEHAIRLACEQEMKKARCWKWGTYGFAVTTAVVIVAWGLK